MKVADGITLPVHIATLAKPEVKLPAYKAGLVGTCRSHPLITGLGEAMICNKYRKYRRSRLSTYVRIYNFSKFLTSDNHW